MATPLVWRRQEAHGQYPSDIDMQALRPKKYGLIDLAKRGTGLLNQVNIQNIENAWGAPAIKIPAMESMAGSASATSLTCTFPTNEGVAKFITATILSGSYGFQIDPRLVKQTGVGYTIEKDTMYKITQTERKLADLLESQIYTVVNAAIASTSNSSYTGAGNLFPFAANALQVSLAQHPTFFNYLDSIYQADDFDGGDFEIIGDANLAAIINYYANQGNANNTNTQFQFAGKNFSYSRAVTTTAGAQSTGFAMKQNSVGMYSLLSDDAKNQEEANGIFWDSYDSALLGLPLEVMYTKNCSDRESATGYALNKNGILEQWQMGYNVVILTPSLNTSETNNGIKKFDMLKV